jgi:hypothetical protein
MNIKFLYLTLILLTFACNNNQFNKKIGLRNSFTSQIKKGKSAKNEFQEFWDTFRRAVIDNDYSKIKSLTIFPLETRGEMDSDPIVKYDEKEFEKVIRAYLLQETYLLNEEGSITQLEEIKRTITPETSHTSENEVRIGNLVFEKRDEEWKLVFAYLNIRDENFWIR